MFKHEILRDPEKLGEKINQYFDGVAASVNDHELKTGGVQPWQTETPSIVGLSVFLGVSKRTILEYMNGYIPEDIDENTKQLICNQLQCARDRCEAGALQASAAGRIDSRTAALILGGYGYGQRVEVDQTARVTIAGAGSDDVTGWSE